MTHLTMAYSSKFVVVRPNFASSDPTYYIGRSLAMASSVSDGLQSFNF
jgi:hypothetical protein